MPPETLALAVQVTVIVPDELPDPAGALTLTERDGAVRVRVTETVLVTRTCDVTVSVTVQAKVADRLPTDMPVAWKIVVAELALAALMLAEPLTRAQAKP